MPSSCFCDKSVPDKHLANMDANYIPLGVKIEELSHSKWGPKVIGETKEERKAIAREIRLSQRKEKKKIKSEAKQQRKLNDRLHRKLNRNTEKYDKNKDRNKQRAIDLERQRIRANAVKQAERMAALHDPSGKMFNVGEIIILPGGIVMSKESMERAAEAKEQKDKEDAQRNAIEKRYKDAERAAKLEAEEAQRAIDQGMPAPTEYPAKEALKRMKRPKKISKKQLQRLQQLKPQAVPPKPVIPKGIRLPDEEEDLLALWDITDAEITRRLADKKKEKTQSRKQLIKIQQENKKLNKALKVRKREADNAGVIFDKEKARREILAAMAKPLDHKSESDSDSDSGSSSSSDSDSDSDEEEEEQEATEHTKPKEKKTNAAPAPKLDLELIEKAAEIERARKEKKQAAREKRRQERKQRAAEEAARHAAERVAKSETLEKVQASKEDKEAKMSRRAAKEAKRLAKALGEDSASKKRKRTEDVEGIAEEKPKKETSHKKKKVMSETTNVDPVQDTRLAKKEKKVKESSDERLDKVFAERGAKMKTESNDEGPSHGAEQWNPDALTGDAARKDKFLRLLGAGKGSSKGGEKDKKKKKDAGIDIVKIQEELERQFQAGVKMKHDGGSKKRGLGA
ncbi:hypothetical protein BKA65DRAFT_36189 [Rhexocercosporidium sp. MPI-PUGE-AT-0058]|nr:hypothetical protein BKA65DRAFT_36189 [Rhexocercosporidium sp. MPI-PUGE-AT-0058]